MLFLKILNKMSLILKTSINIQFFRVDQKSFVIFQCRQPLQILQKMVRDLFGFGYIKRKVEPGFPFLLGTTLLSVFSF